MIGLGLGLLTLGGNVISGASAGTGPVNTAAPVVTGSLPIGSTLSSTRGTWSGSPTSYVDQWLRDGNPISGANSLTYVTVAADAGRNITRMETAVNAGGSNSVVSNAIVPTVTFNALTMSPASASVGVAYSGTMGGTRISGSTLSLTGAGTAGLAIDNSTGAITGTPTASGAVNIVETVGALSNVNAGVLNCAVVVSPNPITLPSGARSFWSLLKSNGYSGAAIRVQRSSDNTETDIGFDANGVVDTAAILAFVGAGTGYVSKVYDQVGSIHQVQATQSLMPIIAQAGAVLKTASGLPMMRGCVGGRNMRAAGAFTPYAGQEFSLSMLAQNDNAQNTTSTTAYSPIIGGSTSAGSSTMRWQLMFGQRTSWSRSISFEMASQSAASNEVTGWTAALAALTTGLLSVNCQAAALSGGPGAGSTLFYQRSKMDDGTTAGTVDNSNHSPAALTTITDICLFQIPNTTWTTNSANGASVGIVSAYFGGPMTDAQRQSIEGQVIDKCAAVIGQSLALPSLGTTGEAWPFATYASNKVAGIKGNADLNFQTAANGSSFSISTPANGIPGLYEGVTTNFQNDFEASNNLGATDRSFTMWAVVTVDDTPAARIEDFIVHGVGTLGSTSGRYVSALLGKDHSPLVAYSLDSSNGVVNDYTNLMNGNPSDPNAGAPGWLPYSPFMGGGLLSPVIPAHDNNSDHPPFYTKKHFFRDMQADDKNTFAWLRSQPIMILMKHKPHPNYDFAKAFNDPANIPWRNKATVVAKVAPLGCLDGFGRVPGSILTHDGRAATSIAAPTAKIRHWGGEVLNSFKGWTHAAGWIGKYTTDAEDQALFYKLTNPANIAALAAA